MFVKLTIIIILHKLVVQTNKSLIYKLMKPYYSTDTKKLSKQMTMTFQIIPCIINVYKVMNIFTNRKLAV